MPYFTRGIRLSLFALSCVALARGQSTVLTASPNPSVFGKPVNLTASVPTNATGKVTFYDGLSILGVSAVTSGQAVLVTRSIGSGSRLLLAYYSGDSNNAAALSPPVPQAVTPSPANGLAPVLTYPTGAGPVSVAVGDFNRDGKPDFATVNFSDSTVSLLFGNGDGTFQHAVGLPLDRTPRAIAAADLDGNGTLDLVIAGAGGITLIPGNGDGTFQPIRDISTGGDPIGLITADLNMDGRVDLAIVTQNDSGLYVLLGNGDGTFGNPARYALSAAGQGIVVGDFNHDGKADLVASVSSAAANQVGLFFGNGDGTLQSPIYISTGAAAQSLAVGDFNGDGRTDLAFISGVNAVGIMLGAAAGGLLAPTTVPASSPAALAAADFNADGKLDLAYVSGNPSTVNLAFGNGDGTFQSPAPYPAGANPTSITLAELSGDGRLDVIVTESTTGISQAGVLLGINAGLNVAVDNSVGLVRGSNSSFNITISNSAGSNTTVGAVTLAINIPSPLTLVSVSGTGWQCSNASCSRADVLNGGSAYQPLTVTVTIPIGAPGIIDIATTLTGGGAAPVNLSTPFSIPPLGPTLVSPANGVAGVLLGPTLTWSSSLGATSYDVYVGTTSPPPLVWNTTATTYTTGSLAPCTTYYWQIAGRSSGGAAPSPIFTFTTGPSVSLLPAGAVYTPAGGPGSFQVFTPSACAWTATPTDPWITVTSSPTVTGSATVNYSVAPNVGSQRIGGVTVAGITFPILQNAGCGVSFGPSAVTVDSTTQTLTVPVTAGSCSWPAVSGTSWLTVTTPSLQSGNATVSIQVGSNTTNAPRTGTVTIGISTYTVTQRQTATVFADVNPSNPFFDAINIMQSMSITSGCLANPLSYCPDANVTRGQMAVFIVRAVMGGDSFTYTPAPYFNDVGPANSFFKWIQKMRDLGITTGCGTNLFCPNDPVTRAQMAVFVIRARYGASSTFSYSTNPLFTDVSATNTYFPWIQKMDQVGITTGCGTGLYCPDSLVTRGQMAVFIIRGAFNQLLPSGTPGIASIGPSSLAPGGTGTFTITGTNTNFAAGTTVVTAGDGITVSNVNVSSATSLTAQFAIDPNATLGPRSIVVTTGQEEATLPNGFAVH